MHLPNGIELILIVGLILVLFGGSKLPGFAKGLGEGIREFRKALKEEEPAKKTDAIEPEKKDEPSAK